MTDEQIKHMVNRFLGWRLPDNFRPDGGVNFTPVVNGNVYQPIGTNLLDAGQAEAMIRYLTEGMPMLETPKCCHLGCREDATYHIAWGNGPDDYTESCAHHVGYNLPPIAATVTPLDYQH